MIRLPEDYNKISIKYTKQVECNWHANKIWIGISLKKNVYRRGYARILTDSARKRIRKDVLANNSKTRINIGHQHDRWMELKEALGVQTHAEVPLRMYFGIFFVIEYRQTTFHTYVLMVYINGKLKSVEQLL